jgi:hypothetical protein
MRILTTTAALVAATLLGWGPADMAHLTAAGREPAQPSQLSVTRAAVTRAFADDDGDDGEDPAAEAEAETEELEQGEQEGEAYREEQQAEQQEQRNEQAEAEAQPEIDAEHEQARREEQVEDQAEKDAAAGHPDVSVEPVDPDDSAAVTKPAAPVPPRPSRPVPLSHGSSHSHVLVWVPAGQAGNPDAWSGADDQCSDTKSEECAQ